MAASVLERAPEQINEILRQKSRAPIDPRIRSLLEAVERDIRLNLPPPFTKTGADHLSSLIRALLTHVVEDLVEAPAGVNRPVTAAIELQRLKNEGVDILDEIRPYAMLAEHHFSREVMDRRLGRPTDVVSKEIDKLSSKAKILKDRIVKYLQDLHNCFAEAGYERNS